MRESSLPCRFYSSFTLTICRPQLSQLNCSFVSDVPSSLSARVSVGGFPEPLYIAHRWDTKDAFVLPIEVGGIVVSDPKGRICRVKVFAQHQTAGLLQAQLFLELQRTHGCHRLEVMMEAGDAHA